jgi:hypothetical protein
VQDFNLFGPPLPGGILPGCDPDLLSRAEALSIALATLVHGHLFTKDNFSVRNLNPPQHAVPALDEDPAGNDRLVCRRINDLPTKRAIDS